MAEYKSIQIGEKSAMLPLIQGGMGVGVSLSGLAGAVAKEGGIGIISSAQIGFREPDFQTHTREANQRAMEKELEKARFIARSAGPCEGLLGFNIMVALRDYEEHVRTAVSVGADVIISGAGLPVNLPGLVEGSQTKIAPIVSSEKAARIILKMWDKNYHRTADFLVVEGAHAGGHLGFPPETLSHIYEEGYDACYDLEIERIITCARSFGEKYGVHIPVFVAGGIMDASSVQHALALGADGVQVATPFVVTQECDADPAFKQAYLDAGQEDIRIIKSPVGMPARAIHNAFLDRIQESREPVDRCYGCLGKCNPGEVPYCITQALMRSVQGDVANGLIFCGDDVVRLHRMTSVHEVIGTLFP